MKRRRHTSIRCLIRKLIFSFCLTILGSWGLLFTRIQVVIASDIAIFDDNLNRLVDLASLSLVFLGLLMAIYYRLLLSPRLRRLDELGEGTW